MFYEPEIMPQNNMPVFRDTVSLNQKTGKMFFNRDSGQTTFSTKLFATAWNKIISC